VITDGQADTFAARVKKLERVARRAKDFVDRIVGLALPQGSGAEPATLWRDSVPEWGDLAEALRALEETQVREGGS
jgi:hypothetical protein